MGPRSDCHPRGLIERIGSHRPLREPEPLKFWAQYSPQQRHDKVVAADYPQLMTHPGQKHGRRHRAGLLTPGSQFSSAFPKPRSPVAFKDDHSPVTVAGAAAASHRVPIQIPLRGTLSVYLPGQYTSRRSFVPRPCLGPRRPRPAPPPRSAAPRQKSAADARGRAGFPRRSYKCFRCRRAARRTSRWPSRP
jgi:hypothetical protein